MSAFSAVRQALQEAREIGALAQLGMVRVPHPARPRVPGRFAIAVTPVEAIGTAQARWHAGQGFDLELHHPFGRKGQHLTHKVGISPFSISSIRTILSSVIVISVQVQVRNSNPNRRPAVTTPGRAPPLRVRTSPLSGSVLHHAPGHEPRFFWCYQPS